MAPGLSVVAVSTLLTVSALGGLSAAPSPAPQTTPFVTAAAGADTALPGVGSFNVVTSPALPGEQILIEGTLEPAVRPMARVVHAQVRTVTGWLRIGSGKSDRNGVVKIKARIDAYNPRTEIRLYAPAASIKTPTGVKKLGAIMFPAFNVTSVNQTVEANVPDVPTLKSKGTATVTVTPGKAGQPVVLQARLSGAWVRVGAAKTDASGVASVAFIAKSDANLIYRVVTLPVARSAAYVSPLTTAVSGAGSTAVVNDTDYDGLVNGQERTYGSSETLVDTDSDGIPDGDEVNQYGTSPTNDDTDSDGLLDGFEVDRKLDAKAADSDDDGLTDAVELGRPGLRPLKPDFDADADGLYDSEETYYRTKSKLFDTDGDGDEDGYEIQIGSNPLVKPGLDDTDGDGLTDGQEDSLGFDSAIADRDEDGLLDGDEYTYGTEPNNADTDGDDLGDYLEVYGYGSDPTDPDTDAGGAEDGLEALAYLNPLKAEDDGADTDGDSIPNVDEVTFGSDPRKPDTDGDGLRDDRERTLDTDPNNPDTDSDGVKDGAEVDDHGTDPLSVDTDGDGVDDGDEVAAGTNPANASEGDPATTDTDGDGLTNAEETALGTNHRAADTDADGLIDSAEVDLYDTDPKVADTDTDGLKDGDEVNVHHSDPKAADTDGDGLKDGAEVKKNADPLVTDTDGDGWNDGDEVNLYTTSPADTDTDDDGVGDDIEIGPDTSGSLAIDFNPKDAYSWAAETTAKRTKAQTMGVNDGEYLAGTDTDNDRLKDFAEVGYGTNKTLADTDGDSLTDGAEVLDWTTHPLTQDTDRDGVKDQNEVGPATRGGLDVDLDPKDTYSWAVPFGKRAEAVTKGVNDSKYLNYVDSNGDGTPDFAEIQPPTHAPDTDGDGLYDDEEGAAGTDPLKTDTDGDGLDDKIEVKTYTTNPLSTDTDSDGLGDAIEAGPAGLGALSVDLNPKDAHSWAIPSNKRAAAVTAGVDDSDYYDNTDSDTDGLKNYAEVLAGTNKSSADTDGDSVSDGSEVNSFGTDPLKVDTDNDGVSDALEVGATQRGPLNIDLDPKDAYSWAIPSNKRAAALAAGVTDNDYLTGKDTDGDGQKDYQEVLAGTSKTSSDTDNDGLSDGYETATSLTDPLVADTDGDGLTDGYEVNTSTTNPKVVDTDGDGLNDKVEVTVYLTNPKAADTDGDTLTDGAEVNVWTTEPTNIDTDGDSVRDDVEVGTTTVGPLSVDLDPKDAYSWAVPSGIRPAAVAAGVNDGAYKNLADTDGDTVKDYAEVGYGTSKTMADTDSDGAGDAAEVGTGLVGGLNVDLDPLNAYSWAITPNKVTAAQSAPYQVKDGAYLSNTDTDGELLVDYREVIAGTSKTVVDTDSDLVNDYVEVALESTDPLDFLDRKHAWTKVSSGGSHTCGIDSASKLYCWGRNNSGQLGIGSSVDSTRPYPVQQSWNWTAVSAGATSTCAIRSTGALYCWGLNTNGQLGTGNTTSQNAPTQVGTATTWTMVEVANTHACGIQGNNTQIQCWGLNANGQLGDNTTTQRTAPTGGVYTNVIQMALNATSFSPGGAHTCLFNGGTLYCTGLNTNGQVGDNSTTQRTQFTSTGTTGWSTITSGAAASCGVKSPGASGTLWCWGSNVNKQVGDGSAADRKAPTQIGTALTGWSTVDAGGDHACAVRSGSLYCWGLNSSGELGLGTTATTATPTQVGTNTNWSLVSAGVTNTCAVRADNTLYCWGENTYGQIGNNTTSASSASPIAIK